MHIKYCSVVALVTGSLAQTMNVTSALASQPSLTNLTSFLSSFPQLLSALSTAQNITILAPSDEAFSAILSSPIITQNDSAAIETLLTYHVLNGTYPASDVKSTPAFLPTLLKNSKYSNVTGGQVVEAIMQGTSVEFFLVFLKIQQSRQL